MKVTTISGHGGAKTNYYTLYPVLIRIALISNTQSNTGTLTTESIMFLTTPVQDEVRVRIVPPQVRPPVVGRGGNLWGNKPKDGHRLRTTAHGRSKARDRGTGSI